MNSGSDSTTTRILEDSIRKEMRAADHCRQECCSTHFGCIPGGASENGENLNFETFNAQPFTQPALLSRELLFRTNGDAFLKNRSNVNFSLGKARFYFFAVSLFAARAIFDDVITVFVRYLLVFLSLLKKS